MKLRTSGHCPDVYFFLNLRSNVTARNKDSLGGLLLTEKLISLNSQAVRRAKGAILTPVEPATAPYISSFPFHRWNMTL